ncbi:MAG: LacI family DNA-binding transcriptional regulator [Chloroflexi bacterium]|nr:LacI family DNA-binding transcriptional regulator [Chloroflexota bacterium]
MATISDIARQAGVSKVTVSRVLNNRPDVSTTTRERVLRIVSELRYSPDARARGLAHRRSRVIGLLMDDLTTPFMLDSIRGVERVVRQGGYQLILANSDGSPAQEQASLRLFREHRVDGIIAVPCRFESPAMVELHRDGVPIVLMKRYLRDAELDAVLNDHRAVGRIGTLHLARAGRQRIALILRRRDISTVFDRLRGYREALEELGRPFDPSLVVKVEETFEGSRAGTHRLLRLADPPDAIFAYNDSVALGVFRALTDHGLTVPDDVAVLGGDRLVGGDQLSVPLTTIAQLGDSIGERAARLLLRRIEKGPGDVPQRILVPPQLIVRESCGARQAGLETGRAIPEASA